MQDYQDSRGAMLSPSSRRAWIEIERPESAGERNGRRPPRGGRGLKFGALAENAVRGQVALLAEGVD